VYGKLIPALSARSKSSLYSMDACMDQLYLAQSKCISPLHAASMNAEYLGYHADVFDHVILFFLLHEMPPQARQHTLSEMLRITRPGGCILVTEYGVLPIHHLLYRFTHFRRILGRLEPFLPGFWHEDLDAR